MCRCQSYPRFLPVVVVVGIMAWMMFDSFSSTSPPTDRDAMLGTWTDEAGEPGNSIRFYYIAKDIPGAPYATALEGHLTLNGFLGEKQTQAIWNYSGWDPLVLNIIVGKQAWYAAILKQDDDHILIRFGKDPSEMMQPGSIDHAETRLLTRIGRE
jgi:hypothetical protein